jgi:hypothetical protein
VVVLDVPVAEVAVNVVFAPFEIIWIVNTQLAALLPATLVIRSVSTPPDGLPDVFVRISRLKLLVPAQEAFSDAFSGTRMFHEPPVLLKPSGIIYRFCIAKPLAATTASI